jgi:hypothetical protein
VLDFEGVGEADTTALDMLADLLDEQQRAGRVVAIARANDRVVRRLERAGLVQPPALPSCSRRSTPPSEPSSTARPGDATGCDDTYEEAILREYHADKGPGFDIGKGLVPGEMHLSAGQEPVAAGVCAHLTTDDASPATHRPHHLAIAHGDGPATR